MAEPWVTKPLLGFPAGEERAAYRGAEHIPSQSGPRDLEKEPKMVLRL